MTGALINHFETWKMLTSLVRIVFSVSVSLVTDVLQRVYLSSWLKWALVRYKVEVHQYIGPISDQ